jgi:hypothetical protein
MKLSLNAPKTDSAHLPSYPKNLVRQHQMNGNNFALAISFSQISAYYSNPLAKCAHSDKILDVHLKIQLVSKDIRWQFKPLAFAHNGQTCRISVVEDVAVESTQKKPAALPFTFERRVTDIIALVSDSPLQKKVPPARNTRSSKIRMPFPVHLFKGPHGAKITGSHIRSH